MQLACTQAGFVIIGLESLELHLWPQFQYYTKYILLSIASCMYNESTGIYKHAFSGIRHILSTSQHPFASEVDSGDPSCNVTPSPPAQNKSQTWSELHLPRELISVPVCVYMLRWP
mgnify:CR=1 FL=1